MNNHEDGYIEDFIANLGMLDTMILDKEDNVDTYLDVCTSIYDQVEHARHVEAQLTELTRELHELIHRGQVIWSEAGRYFGSIAAKKIIHSSHELHYIVDKQQKIMASRELSLLKVKTADYYVAFGYGALPVTPLMYALSEKQITIDIYIINKDETVLAESLLNHLGLQNRVKVMHMVHSQQNTNLEKYDAVIIEPSIFILEQKQHLHMSDIVSAMTKKQLLLVRHAPRGSLTQFLIPPVHLSSVHQALHMVDAYKADREAIFDSFLFEKL